MSILSKAIIAASVFVMPVAAMAYPLTVTNLTNGTISAKVNGQCSEEYGNINGMTSHSAETKRLESICKNTSPHCQVVLHNSASCNGEIVANFFFNSKTRTTGEGSAAPHFTLSIEAHRVILKKS
ncbi:MAG TPA: hypothetical protein VL360_05650 [Gammaproteobacteria bacterium]|jgi:hypothetical protein|nr:hypothetical protein [Gammaproteobacteria bacterium]